MKRPMSFFITILLLLLFASFALASGAVSIQWGDDSKGGSNGGSYKKKGGPPPHAPAHGYRAKHQYRYYPACNVYHDSGRGLYFYVKVDGWAVGASLPPDLMGGLGAAVSLEMDTDKPYEHNAEHVKQYPKEKYKSDNTRKK